MNTADGRPRRLGVEIEFAGIDVATAATCVTALFGGEVTTENSFAARVAGTPSGEFKIEVDAHFLHNDGYREALAAVGIDIDALDLREPLETLLASVAGIVVPLEVCAPPIAMRELPLIEKLIVALRSHGALGTGHSPLYAFGLQFNPEVENLEPDYILRTLQAFLCQVDIITARRSIDLTRRLAPFVRSFSEDFVAFFLQPDYRPDITTLIDDYLRLNPSRNRPLDLLPLFAHIDRDRVLEAAAEPHLIKPRPTFHYRLPDCHIDRTDWTLAVEWAGWVDIETLAADEDALARALAGHR